MNTASNNNQQKNPFKGGGMFDGANYLLFELAKDLRRNMTDAENVLWMHLKAGINGYKIRKQHPIGIYIADFYCHKKKLIIEIDGSIHNNPEVREYDERRQKDLEDKGYRVIRFTNKEVMTAAEMVISKIKEELK
jgi:imidazole glycerol-phosphate synthase subunit HisF